MGGIEKVFKKSIDSDTKKFLVLGGSPMSQKIMEKIVGKPTEIPDLDEVSPLTPLPDEEFYERRARREQAKQVRRGRAGTILGGAR